MHVRRGVILIHKTDFSIHIDKCMVFDHHKCSLIAIHILKLLHATFLLKLSAEGEAISPACVEHCQCIADEHLSRESRVLKRRERAQERGSQQKAEFKELLVGLLAQFLLAVLSGNPEEIRVFRVEFGDQLIEIEEESFRGSKDSVNERVVAFGKVGKLAILALA